MKFSFGKCDLIFENILLHSFWIIYTVWRFLFEDDCAPLLKSFEVSLIDFLQCRCRFVIVAGEIGSVEDDLVYRVFVLTPMTLTVDTIGCV